MHTPVFWNCLLNARFGLYISSSWLLCIVSHFANGKNVENQSEFAKTNQVQSIMYATKYVLSAEPELGQR